MITPLSRTSVSLDFPALQSKRVYNAAKLILEIGKAVIQEYALLVGKIIMIPLLLTSIVIMTTLTALSILLYRQKPVFFAQCSSLLAELCSCTIALAKYGMVVRKEQLELADKRPDSPQFAIVTPEKQTPDAVPILYAPGYMSSPEDMMDDCRRLANLVGAPVYIVKYRFFFQSIKEHAKDVSRVADRILLDTGKNDLVVIGHSMGGVTTGRFIERENTKMNIRLWVTIASPLKGTWTARLAFGKCAKQMRPDASFMRKFQTYERLKKIRSLHLYTSSDLIVWSSSAQGFGDNYECKKLLFGHTLIRTCKEVEEQIQRAIFSMREPQSVGP